VIIPKVKHPAKIWATRERKSLVDDEGEEKKAWAIQAGIGLPKIELGAKDAAGSSKVFEYQIYVGPKEYKILADMDYDLVQVLDYGWFGWISRFLIWLMTALEGISGSWGIAIIAITFVIRIVIWPLHHRSTKTFKRMALLNPLMKDIREKHADNPQRMNQEMMKLYKDYGVNPLGGCFPLLLQIPIFFGYFTMLRSAVEIRHHGFLWATDLSLPDTVAHVMGVPINPLPFLMAITMVLQMKMTPKTGDSTQQKIMMFMPLIFFVFCYTFPSALALYWTSQNIISIGQTWITRNMPDPVLEKRVDEEKAKAAVRKSHKGSGNAPGAKRKRKR
jgi:YidC/Oxa1 family membrane protein insertase